MRRDEIEAIFNQQAAGYDKQWARMAPIRDCLHYLLQGVLLELPRDARILCVGAGTGVEIGFLASAFPHWRFTAIDPSGPMLDVCRHRARDEGFEKRCQFFEGYLESLPPMATYDGATSFLVSQFILEREARVAYFQQIAQRLRPGAILASSDLSADVGSSSYDELLRLWFSLMSSAGLTAEALQRMRANYARDVAILPDASVASILTAAGFESPVTFFQGGLIRAWFARIAA